MDVNWIITNWGDILVALKNIGLGIAVVVAAVSALVRLTPTLKDDNIWLPIVKWLSKYIAWNRTVNDDQVRSQMTQQPPEGGAGAQ